MVSTLSVGHVRLAYHHHPGAGPGILFCGGFHSSMQGTKALYLERLCQERGWPYTRFDYQGHGLSSGRFSQCTLDHWYEDVLAILDGVCQGPQILVGSSMGSWLAVLAGLARPDTVAGLVGLASAPDFTEELVWPQLDETARALLASGRPWLRPTDYGEGQPYAITQALIDSGRRHRLLRGPIALRCPVRLIHGTNDEDVPYAFSQRLLSQLVSDDVALTLIKHGDHRLSSLDELRMIGDVLGNLVKQLVAE